MGVGALVLWPTVRVQAASIAMRSNPVGEGAITVDGTFGDWSGLEPYPADATGEVSPGDQDWAQVSIAHDSQTLYLRLARAANSTGFRAPITPGGTTGGLGYWVIIDTDGNTWTGLRSAGGRSFSVSGEYNLGGALALNRWSVSGGWLGDVPFTAVTSGLQLEIGISRLALGDPSTLRFVLVGETSGDYYPAQGASTDYFEYQLDAPPVIAAGEVALRSNPVAAGTIVIDGQLADWENVIPYPPDPAGDGGSSQDWLQAWVAHDETHFYLRYRRAPGSLAFDSPGYWGLLDTDRRETTGLMGFGTRVFAVGADLNTSGTAILNRWSPQSCHESSMALVSSLSADGHDLEMAIPRAEFGAQTKFHLVFMGEDSGDAYSSATRSTHRTFLSRTRTATATWTRAICSRSWAVRPAPDSCWSRPSWQPAVVSTATTTAMSTRRTSDASNCV